MIPLLQPPGRVVEEARITLQRPAIIILTNYRPDFKISLDAFIYLSTSQHNNVWSLIDADNGLSSHTQKHGDFYSEEVTLTSLGYILTHGLGNDL
jgi:hypothetical protein